MAKRAKGFPPLSRKQQKVAKGPIRKVRLGDMDFEQVGDNMLASDKGMSKEELEEFVQGLHGSAKRVVGAQSGRDLSVDDLRKIMKRQMAKKPHLIDLILDGELFNPQMAPPLSVFHQAKKFIFDASASEFVGSLLKKAQHEILSQHDWARPPFETTWIEFDHMAYWEQGLGAHTDYTAGPPDNLFGFLVDHGKVSLFSHAPGHQSGETTGCSPFMYQLHTPISFEEEMRMAGQFNFNLMHYRQALLGGMLTEGGDLVGDVDWWRTIAGEVVRAHKMYVNPMFENEMLRFAPEKRAQALASGAGDLKLIITLLLMVTRPRKMFTVTETGPRRMLYKGHNLVRRGHSVVTMRLAKEAALHHAVHHEFTSQHRQMHDVRGHWAETRHGDMCREHSWEPIDKDHFYCLNCPAKRWWRKAHTRGELRLGDKTTDYVVKR
jgi:hypothetical protein